MNTNCPVLSDNSGYYSNSIDKDTTNLNIYYFVWYRLYRSLSKNGSACQYLFLIITNYIIVFLCCVSYITNTY